MVSIYLPAANENMPISLRIVHVGNNDLLAMDGVSAAIVGQCKGVAELGIELEIWTLYLGMCIRYPVTATRFS